METLHAEGDSSFEVKENCNNGDSHVKADEELVYAECPVDGCGEVLLLDEMEYHLELHGLESGQSTEVEPASSTDHSAHASGSSTPSRSHREAERQRRTESAVSGNQAKTISAWKKLLRMPESTSTLSSRRRKDVKPTAPPDTSRGKRLGVGSMRTN